VKESADTLCLSGCFCLTETLAAIKAKTGPPVTPVMVSESGEKKTKKPLIIIFPIDMAIKVGCFIDVHRFIISNPPLNHHGEPAPTLRLRPPISTIAPMTRIVLEKYKSSLQEVFFATKFSGYGENNT
jgi:hypothetical protein